MPLGGGDRTAMPGGGGDRTVIPLGGGDRTVMPGGCLSATLASRPQLMLNVVTLDCVRFQYIRVWLGLRELSFPCLTLRRNQQSSCMPKNRSNIHTHRYRVYVTETTVWYMLTELSVATIVQLKRSAEINNTTTAALLQKICMYFITLHLLVLFYPALLIPQFFVSLVN